MQLEHEFTVPVPPDEAWRVLLDVERVAPCMPGATLESFTGDEFTGKVKVKVGPITVTYSGKGRFMDRDDAAKSVVIEATGKEVRGQGTAKANVHTRLVSEGDHTKVTVTTDLNVTGRPAQFGRGVMAEVGGKLIGRFASSLAEEISGEKPAAAGAKKTADAKSRPAAAAGAGARDERHPGGSSMAPDEGAAGEPSAPSQAGAAAATGAMAAGAGVPRAAEPAPPGAAAGRPAQREAEPIDLLETAGLPVLKRLGPVVGALVMVGLVVWWWAHRG